MRAIVLAGLVCGCVTPYGPSRGLGGYEDFSIGRDQHQIVVDGNEFTGHSTLLRYLHRRAWQLCGVRGYAMSNTTVDTTTTPAPLGGEDATLSYTTVSAIVTCKPRIEKARCVALDPELEALRPPGYVSPDEEGCEPAPAE